MKKFLFLALLLINLSSWANQPCTIHIEAEGFNTLQTARAAKLLKKLNYQVVSKSEHANYKLLLKKERYFNVYGYPHFFMREINLEFYSNDIKLYDTFSSDGFPVYEALGEVLDDLEVNENFCSKHY